MSTSDDSRYKPPHHDTSRKNNTTLTNGIASWNFIFIFYIYNDNNHTKKLQFYMF